MDNNGKAATFLQPRELEPSSLTLLIFSFSDYSKAMHQSLNVPLVMAIPLGSDGELV